jgi:hypothetical protein
VASIVCAVLVMPSMMITIMPTMFVALFTRPDTGSNGKEWMANFVFLSLPGVAGTARPDFWTLRPQAVAARFQRVERWCCRPHSGAGGGRHHILTGNSARPV